MKKDKHLGHLTSDQQKQIKQYKVCVSMQGQSQMRVLVLQQHQLKSLRILKKKILNQFDFEQSQGTKIKLNIMQIYPTQPSHLKTPITSDINLKMIIDFLLCNQRKIKILVDLLVDKQSLKRKQFISQQAIQNCQLHFDQNGSLIEQTDPMELNIPANLKYNNSVGNVRCQFCLKNNKDALYLKRCGGLYSPLGKQNEMYVHLLCALWCHQVFLDDQDNLRNVQESVKIAQKRKCFHCKQAGAGLQCIGRYFTKDGKSKKCHKYYHFKCAVDRKCHLNWKTYKMHCQMCQYDQQNSQTQKNQQKEHNRKKRKRKLKKNNNLVQVMQNQDQYRPQQIEKIQEKIIAKFQINSP